MKNLLLACMILFAVIALPAGAENETGTVFAAETAAEMDSGSQQETTVYPDSSRFDPFMEVIFEESSEIDHTSSDENTPAEEASAKEDIAGEEASSNLNILLISSASESEESDLNNDADTDDIGAVKEIGSDESDSSDSYELYQTSNAFDQLESVMITKPEIIPNETHNLQVGKRETLELISSEFSGNIVKKISTYSFQSEENSTGITDMRDYFREERFKTNNAPEQIAYKEITKNTANRAGLPVPYIDIISSETEPIDIRDQYSRLAPSFDLLSALSDDTKNTNRNVAEIFRTINTGIDKLQNPRPKETDTSTVFHYLRPFTPLDFISIEADYITDSGVEKENNKLKKYAIVVGINEYSDRRSLRAPVNDAEEMAKLLKDHYGYEVIKLTDNTDDKPTKHNILDGAIAEIKAKQDRGNVVIYFSGHGEKDASGNFYLIPQNASGNPANYISREELKQYIKDFKDLYLIVDACYSGELASIKENDGQLILASSNNTEPSNEIWTRPNSIFTYSLCKAIRETGKWGDEIPLKVGFDKAQNETAQLAQVYWQSQNPISS